jgi:hypothetical protein
VWKATERKKAIPAPPPPRRLGLWAAGIVLLLIPMGWLGFAGGDGTIATVSRYAFFLLATLAALAFAAGRRRL